jgi:protein-disulfide isomerase
MSSNQINLQNIGAGLAVGLIIGGTGAWFLAKPHAIPAGSKSACFLSSGPADTIFGTVDGKNITSANLPQDMQSVLLQSQSEHNRRLSDMLNEVAVRYQAAKEQGKNTAIESLPSLKELAATGIKPEDVRKFYDNNKNSFPKMEFAQVETMLRRHLEQQQQNSFLQGRLSNLKSKNLLTSSLPVPCGPKAIADVPATALRSGKSARFELVFVTDYQCGPCRYMKEGLKSVVESYKDNLSVAQVVYAGAKKNSTNEFLVRGLFCAKSVGDETKQVNYHNAAYFSNIKYDSTGAVTDEADVKRGALDAAKRANVDETAFKKCLDSKDAEEFVETGRKYVADSKLEQAPAFFLNGRRLAVPPQLNIGEIVGEIIEEVAPSSRKTSK